MRANVSISGGVREPQNLQNGSSTICQVQLSRRERHVRRASIPYRSRNGLGHLDNCRTLCGRPRHLTTVLPPPEELWGMHVATLLVLSTQPHEFHNYGGYHYNGETSYNTIQLDLALPKMCNPYAHNQLSNVEPSYRTLLELLSVRVPPSTTTVSSPSALKSGSSSSSHAIVSTASRKISVSPVSGEGMTRYWSTSTHAALSVVCIHGQSTRGGVLWAECLRLLSSEGCI